jgi:hypothetical protein
MDITQNGDLKAAGHRIIQAALLLAGKRIVNAVPLPGSLRTEIKP